MNRNYQNIELAYRALQVALSIEIDYTDAPQVLAARDYLAEWLSTITSERLKQSNRNLMVLRKAIPPNRGEAYWEDKSTDDLLLQICLAEKDLRDLGKLPNERKKSIYDFCIELNTQLTEYDRQFCSSS